MMVLGLNGPRSGVGNGALAARLRQGFNAYTYNDGNYGAIDANNQPAWMNRVSEDIKDPHKHITVTLDGLNGERPIDKFRNAMFKGQRIRTVDEVMNANGTNWEMSQLSVALATGQRTPYSITWYLDGEQIQLELPETDEGWRDFKNPKKEKW